MLPFLLAHRSEKVILSTTPEANPAFPIDEMLPNFATKASRAFFAMTVLDSTSQQILGFVTTCDL
jgi:hypothetical protein